MVFVWVGVNTSGWYADARRGKATYSAAWFTGSILADFRQAERRVKRQQMCGADFSNECLVETLGLMRVCLGILVV